MSVRVLCTVIITIEVCMGSWHPEVLDHRNYPMEGSRFDPDFPELSWLSIVLSHLSVPYLLETKILWNLVCEVSERMYWYIWLKITHDGVCCLSCPWYGRLRRAEHIARLLCAMDSPRFIPVAMGTQLRLAFEEEWSKCGDRPYLFGNSKQHRRASK